MRKGLGFVGGLLAGILAATTAGAEPPFQQHDLMVKDFHFRSGETLPALKLHYWTLGQPKTDAAGHVTTPS